MELDLAYLCKEVREIARASATFLKDNDSVKFEVVHPRLSR